MWGDVPKRMAVATAVRRAGGSRKSEAIALRGSAGLISCYDEGGVMSEADALLEEVLLWALLLFRRGRPPTDWEFAERILKRLNPRNQQHVYDMAARDSKNGGMLITLMVVVWWLFIGGTNDDLSAGVSVFFSLNFEQALAVMVLSLFSALLTEFSRDMGKILPSTAAGGNDSCWALRGRALGRRPFHQQRRFGMQLGLWRTLRLGLLWGGTTYGSNLIVNALLLKWLIRFLDSNDYDFSERNEPTHRPPAGAAPEN